MPMKRQLTDLALFGGPPAFERVLHVGRPNIGDRQRLQERLDDILDRRWLTNHGPYVAELEARLAGMLGVKHCLATCNATIALEIAARALGLSGEVIVPSFTFVATAHCLQWQQITPVFCDVDPHTHNLDPAQVERMITPRTTGLIGVHVWGQPCDVEALEQVAQRHNLKLMFDAAHAFGCSHRGRMIGNFGQAEVFSFHATKFFNTFEGGAIATNDDELAERMRLMHNFGFAGLDTVVDVGTNGKMSEIAAAMGLTGLESLDEFIAINYRNYQDYRRYLSDVPGLRLLTWDEAEKHNYQYVVLEINRAVTGLSRDRLVELLHAENVRARRYFYPGCHRMEPYRSYFPHAGLLLPVTERLTECVLTLPTGTAIEPEDVARICDLITLALAHGPEIEGRQAGLDSRLRGNNGGSA
jgi:dTDP-4-amino-4,6-dideoxygalactose transaminase